jgi:hypothetical protein
VRKVCAAQLLTRQGLAIMAPGLAINDAQIEDMNIIVVPARTLLSPLL